MVSSSNQSMYSGEIVAGSLLFTESRAIAKLLLKNVNHEQWERAIVVDNILQKRSPVTAKRQARLIKNRLVLFNRQFWTLIDNGSSEVVAQALLAATIKQNGFVRNFMDQVLRKNWQMFKKTISLTDWTHFLETCIQIHPQIDTWSDSTRKKLKQVIFRILCESKYIDDIKSLNLQPVTVLPEVRAYLVEHSEDDILRCMEITEMK